MGIYTERKIGTWTGAAILAAAFAVLYGIWLAGGPELRRSEVVYAAAAAEFSARAPLLVKVHGWSTPECFPLFPLAARLVRELCPALPMESILRGLSILMLAAGAGLVYFAASSRRSSGAGLVAAAMYSTSFLALGAAVEGTPATTNAFLLAAAQQVFFFYGVRRAEWNRAWICSTILVTLGFFSGGFTVLLFFVFPMLFFRRPLSVSSKFRRPGFAAALALVVLAALAWSGAFTSELRQISPYEVWWHQLADVRLGWGLAVFPFAVIFWMLPWSLLMWMPFCVALQSVDETPIYSRYLRTLAFSTLALLWLLPEMGRYGLFYAAAPLSILTGGFYELGVRRYGAKLRSFLVLAEFFLPTVLVLIAAGSFLPEAWLKRFASVDLTLGFRERPGFMVAALALLVAVLLLALYVHRTRRSDPVWMILLTVSVAAALFCNGLMFPYKSQDHSKRKFGADVRRALLGDRAAPGTVIYTRNVRNLTGGLFYAGFPVYRLTPAEGIPSGAEQIYLLSGDFPQSSEYSWENLFPKDYTYNDHPLKLKLWKGTPPEPIAENDASAPASAAKQQEKK
ncbi:MAG: hypothetical protein IJJ28_08165 [Lentisphaeria bacterium]|nr:hypothetical protein [Lentisphaeria bacterium]